VNDADAVNFALLLFRSAVGAIMLAHGINHVFRGGKIAGTAGWFESLGMKPGILHAWLASLTEIGAGAMLIAGLLTPLAAAGVTGTMLVAWITNHRKNGFFIFRPGEGWEYVMSLTVSGIALGALGAGEWSLDDALDIAIEPATGLLISGGLGIGLAVGLLAVFWRPPAPATTT
jgi:putative oxidoreductase